MRGMGYGQGYRYAHDFKEHQVRQQHLPDELAGRKYYMPGDQGSEVDIAKRLESWGKQSPGESQ